MLEPIPELKIGCDVTMTKTYGCNIALSPFKSWSIGSLTLMRELAACSFSRCSLLQSCGSAQRRIDKYYTSLSAVRVEQWMILQKLVASQRVNDLQTFYFLRAPLRLKIYLPWMPFGLRLFCNCMICEELKHDMFLIGFVFQSMSPYESLRKLNLKFSSLYFVLRAGLILLQLHDWRGLLFGETLKLLVVAKKLLL